jgi:hypothetical protein
MTIPQFQTLVSRQPFRPFTVLTSDGREYRVEHPENYWLPPTMPVVGIAWEDRLTLLDVSAIIGVQHEQASVE